MTNYVAALVDELYQLGVREVVISPGSRSTPLSLLFCEHGFTTFLQIDERSAGFFALGIAKARARPVVLVCTSGTAAAHYLPAVIEAAYSQVPLLVLTADRPPELRQVGAPQTIDQNRLFGGFVKYYEELAVPEDRVALCRYARVAMQKAYTSVLTGAYGVAHINVPLREPLIPDWQQLDFTQGRCQERFESLTGECRFTIEQSMFKDKQGLILCGGDAYADYQESVLALGARLKAPVLADPLANIRNYAADIIIDSYDVFLKNDAVQQALTPDYIIHFGQVPVSKRLQQFVALQREALYLQVADSFTYRNPALSTKKYIVAPAKSFAAAITDENTDSRYLDKWLTLQKQARSHLNKARDERGLFEGKVVQMLQDLLPPGSLLAVANSMPIRDVDYFFAARAQAVKILCNRGTNGIDGTVSTALGMATADKPTVLLTGDLAFYHDLNGLLIGKTHNLNLVIVLLNNDGGGIFRYLPQCGEKQFDYLFRTRHGLQFSGLETLYGLNYYEAVGYEDFSTAFHQALAAGGISVIELKIDLELSKRLHDQYTTM